ncbi:MAG TPA: hypothetical protein VGH01_08005 [Jatrophihabitantaceae bacterium]
MAIRDKIRANAAHLLQPGEVIQAVIPAQAANPWLAVISYWIILFSNAFRVIVVTDRRILVCRAGRFTVTQVNEVLHEVPRATRIGPHTGMWYRCDQLGQRVWIARRFAKDVAEADSYNQVATGS